MAERRVCRLLQFGLGTVGQEFARQLYARSSRLETIAGLSFGYGGLFSRSSGLVAGGGASNYLPRLQFGGEEPAAGLVSLLCQGDRQSKLPRGWYTCGDPMDLLQAPEGTLGAVTWSDTYVVDTSTGDSSSLFPFMEQALARGAGLIVANKKLLAGTQQEFSALTRFGPRRLMCETTVGAGLPIISTLRSLLSTGDEILEISGCMSGTLGYICSSLEREVPFSQSVWQARELGFTEPDPRVDLSGQDVARKALILARLWRADQRGGRETGESVRGSAGSVAGGGGGGGDAIELDQIATQPLFPKGMAQLDTDEFLQVLPELDEEYAARMKRAQSRGHTLRYTARIAPDRCRVGLEEVPLDGSMGRGLRGPDNIFQFRTRRYREHPLIVQGPGAGPEVTAAGVVSDLLSSAGVL
jgi:homoserine dehydrogenase